MLFFFRLVLQGLLGGGISSQDRYVRTCSLLKGLIGGLMFQAVVAWVTQASF